MVHNQSSIPIFIQARMNSQRLPGKVLLCVQGKPLLQFLLERLQKVRGAGPVVVLTSEENTDLPISDFCQEIGVECFQGSLKDVALRFLRASSSFDAEAFVRICGDSPFLDQNLIEECIRRYQENKFDLITNKTHFNKRTFPKGMSVELINTKAFDRARSLMRVPEDFEHVTRVLYTNEQLFRIDIFEHEPDYGNYELTVDTPESLRVCKAIFGRMEHPHWEYTMDDVLDIYHEICS